MDAEGYGSFTARLNTSQVAIGYAVLNAVNYWRAVGKPPADLPAGFDLRSLEPWVWRDRSRGLFLPRTYFAVRVYGTRSQILIRGLGSFRTAIPSGARLLSARVFPDQAKVVILWHLRYPDPPPLHTPGLRFVGLDLNHHPTIVTSDGDQWPYPPVLWRCIRRIRRERSRRNRKALEQARRQLFHQVTLYCREKVAILCERYDVIGVEAAVAHPSPDCFHHKRFIELLTKRTRVLGKHLLFVNPKDNSRKCSECGRLLRVEEEAWKNWRCECGAYLLRQLNAAKNVLKRMLEIRDYAS